MDKPIDRRDRLHRVEHCPDPEERRSRRVAGADRALLAMRRRWLPTGEQQRRTR